mmetsp:Transcript_111157/g.278298  ORF Transcript_111157/g.278298 Transcript_111157/m.278298 type:complete len:136 (-) Transcript_111157:306-713(-)
MCCQVFRRNGLLLGLRAGLREQGFQREAMRLIPRAARCHALLELRAPFPRPLRTHSSPSGGWQSTVAAGRSNLPSRFPRSVGLSSMMSAFDRLRSAAPAQRGSLCLRPFPPLVQHRPPFKPPQLLHVQQDREGGR